MPIKPQTDIIQYLVDRKYPGFSQQLSAIKAWNLKQKRDRQLMNLNVDTSKEPLAPTNEIKEKVHTYRNELSELSPLEVDELFQKEHANELSEIEKNQFFNQSEANANFDYWAKMPFWTLEEAIALSLGKNPTVVSEKSLFNIPKNSTFLKEYMELKELAFRAVTRSKLNDPVLPSIFAAWIKDNEISFPEKLAEQVQIRHEKVKDWKKMYDDLLDERNSTIKVLNDIISLKDDEITGLKTKEPTDKLLHTKERESLFKLLLGIAVDSYGYDPRAYRSKTYTEIGKDIAKHGILLDQDTIRKWLKEASQHVSLVYENSSS